MSAPNGPQFKFLYQQQDDTHGLNVLGEDDYSKGWMQWADKTGELQHISVNWDSRRQGIATRMWDRANQLAEERGIPAPVHSPERTKEGDAWAKAVGGDLPKRKAVHYTDGRRGVEMDPEKYETLPD